MRRATIVSGGMAGALALVPLGAQAAGADPKPVSAAAKTRWGTAKIAPPAGAGGPVRVTQGVRFNKPGGTTAQAGAIDLYLKKLIRNSPKGSEIDVALFRLQTQGMAKELVRAKDRGVKVRIVLDSDSLNYRRYIYDYLKQHLGTSTAKPSWILLCGTNRGCIAPAVAGHWSKNHNKFYAFSHTYDSRKVVVQTSGNATGGMYNQYNDAYTAVGNLYDYYRTYFYDLAKRKPNANYWRTRTSGNRSVSYFPKASGDPIVDILRGVGCTGGTRIRLSSGMFTRSGVAGELARLDNAGCDVKAVSGSLGESAVKKLTGSAVHGGPEVHYFPGSGVQAHSKYLLIDGSYQGRKRKLVYTGSHSYTTEALRYNDESMLTIDDRATFDAYAANFATVFAAARGRLSPSPLLATPVVPDDATDHDGETAPTGGTPSAGAPSATPAPAATPTAAAPADGGAAQPGDDTPDTALEGGPGVPDGGGAVQAGTDAATGVPPDDGE
ncbi:phospholipase D-like domain-containing protein [Actinomadura parmotrematis]|uniref:phospholipase D-like domain-containing protein n=1 Tax=Actinomadura parmotrematis TaxID=2864039 RepID=UPI0027E371ED|nr:phospholipase D-like domain-containing protein [Actinomadura parmotrematis]